MAGFGVLAESCAACQEADGMERFIHRQNIEHYRKLLAEATDEAQRRVLLKLLAEEEAKRATASQNGAQKSPPENT